MPTYERSQVEDFPKIAALDREAWKANRNPDFIPDGEHVWRIWVEHALMFSAKEGDEVVGAILAFPCASGDWCVHKVFVRDDQRSKGVGARLFELLLAEVDKLGVDCFLTVDPANTAAIRLYEKWGFGERKFIKGYYRDYEDRFVMTRRARRL
ncbi:MAG: GNAT family N-acetyltransferase [Phycisphaerae bacterium]